MNRTVRKDLLREIKKNFGRFFSIFCIVMLGTAFFAGLRSTGHDMKASADAFYDDQKMMDIRVVSTLGLSEEDIDDLAAIEGVEKAAGGMTKEVMLFTEDASYDIRTIAYIEGINEPVVTEGRLPEKADECLVDADKLAQEGYGIGDRITFESGDDEDLSETLRYETYKVVGIGYMPYYTDLTRGTGSIGDGSIDAFTVLHPDAFDLDIYTEAYITVSGADRLVTFSEEYDETVDAVAKRIEDLSETATVRRYDSVIKEARDKIEDARSEADDGEKELADAAAEIEDGKQEIADAEEEIGEKEKEIEDAKAEIADGEKELADAEEEIADGRNELADAQTEVDRGREELEDARKEAEDGREKLDAAREELEQGKTELAGAQAEVDQGKKELDKAQTEVDQGSKELDDAQKEVDSGRAELIDAKKEIEKNQKALDQAKEQYEEGLEQYSSGLEKYHTGLAKYESGLAEYNEQKEIYEVGVREYEEGAAQYEAGKAAFEEGELQYQENLAEYNIKKEEYDQGRAEYEAGLSAWTKAYADFEAAVAAGLIPEEQAAAQKALLDAQGEELEKTGVVLDAAEQQLEEGKAVLDAASEELEATRAELTQAKAVLDETKTTLEEASAALSEGKETLDSSKAELDDGKAALDESRAQLDEAAGEIASGEEQLKEARKTVEENTAKLDEAQNTIDANREKLGKAQAEIDANAEKLKEGQAEIDKNAAKIVEGQTEIDENAAKLEEGQASIDENAAKIDEAQAEIDEGRTKLDDAQKTVDDNRIEIEDAKKELADGEEKLAEGRQELEENRQKLLDAEEEYNDKYPGAVSDIEDARQKIADAEEEIAKLEVPEWYVLDRSLMESIVGYDQNATRMDNLGKVFPVIFFLVAALVCLTAMTRMVAEQRMQIGTLKALGYSNRIIAGRYFIYSMLATVTGSVIGIAFGEWFFPKLIINSYGVMFTGMTYCRTPVNWDQAILGLAAAVLSTGVAALAACLRQLQSRPAELMRPEAPKNGQRILLERIPFIWKRLGFTKKSSLRNLMRYKKRLIMTVIGVGGCMGLLLVGFGLHDSINEIAKEQYINIFMQDATLTVDSKADEEDWQELEDALAEYPGVNGSERISLISVDLQNKGKVRETYLYIPQNTENIGDYLVLRDRVTKENYDFPKTGAIISEKTAKMLELSVGDEVTIAKEGRKNVRIRIGAITENYVLHYLFLSPETYRELYGEEPEYNRLYVTYEEMTPAQESDLGSRFMKYDQCTGIGFTTELEKNIDDMLAILDNIVYVLIIAAGLLAFVVLYNLNSINITERRRELATLKVLGFFDGEVAWYVYRENVILTLLGCVVGVIIGTILHRFTIVTVEVDLMMFGRTISMPSYIISVIITIVFAVIVNCVMFFSLRKVDMIESLKSVE